MYKAGNIGVSFPIAKEVWYTNKKKKRITVNEISEECFSLTCLLDNEEHK